MKFCSFSRGQPFALSSYMCRHHLTRQAQEDLLKLFHIHLPQNNQLSSSLYTFQKQVSYQEDIELVPSYHYYCSQCFTILPSYNTSQCPNQSCNMTIIHENLKVTLLRSLLLTSSRSYCHVSTTMHAL